MRDVAGMVSNTILLSRIQYISKLYHHKKKNWIWVATFASKWLMINTEVKSTKSSIIKNKHRYNDDWLHKSEHFWK